ncbi:hypothetical protein CLV56_3407 [Mumia flava]|uniref:DUF1731 domain-containing protein n=1 Tax=Mumia flava TaxID=1348852 RepID=A0A0B2B699_9ACTN|nr:TIGR01777 family oxidoreductase [Mumia flava]PJJ53905.1 hypothetical protein CLV56_3407 [Mumia flava]
MRAGTTVALAGATGFVGRHLQRAWAEQGVRVRTIGRGPAAHGRWGDTASIDRAVDGADLLVNLAGRSVSCRYTKRTADEILSSRTETTAQLARSLHRVASPPLLWLNASTGTIYRDARDRPMDECRGELGSGFSVAVARAWEAEAAEAPPDVRVVALRMAFVLGPDGGALCPLIDLARLGLGGRIGDGGQIVSWVHIDDVGRVIDHVVDHPTIRGPVNVAAPDPQPNAAFMRHVREVFGRRVGVPTPAWLLGLGARVLRSEPELVLKSRWVDPGVLTGTGYAFAYPRLRPALVDIARSTPRGLLPVQLG